jgi:hypothetical protein
MDFRHHSTDQSPRRDPPDDARHWTVSDLIDFEYYLDADESELRERPSARKAFAQRDRSLYLDEIAPAVGDYQPHTPTHRRMSLRHWLAARRNAEDAHMRPLLPGAAFGSAQRLVTLLLAVVGFLAGIGVASALLSYDGTRPVSVSWYLFLLVFVQFALVVSVVGAWVLRRTRGRAAAAPPGLLMHVIRPLVTKASGWLQGQRIGHAAAEIQDKARARQGLLKSQYALYGPVSYLPLLIPAQIFGVAFNVGIILTTILLEWFTDLAFGWGSTLNVHPQTIYDLTRLIALPWSWLFGEGIGYPSLEQIAGSRIILEHWATATPTVKPDPSHLRSWGPFLVLAVVTYGLLPRLLLWGASVAAQAFILARLPFTHGRTQSLYARMLSPRLETTTSGARQGTEMPIPALSPRRDLRRNTSEGTSEPATPATARPWRNALVRRPETPVDRPPLEADEPAADRVAPEAPEVVATPSEAVQQSGQTPPPPVAPAAPKDPERAEPERAKKEPSTPVGRAEPGPEAPLVQPEVTEPAPIRSRAEPPKDDEFPKSPDRDAPPVSEAKAEEPAPAGKIDETIARAPAETEAPKPAPITPGGRVEQPATSTDTRVRPPETEAPSPKRPDKTAAPKPAPAQRPTPRTATPPATPPATPTAPAPAEVRPTAKPAPVAPAAKPAPEAAAPPPGQSRAVRFAPDACLLLLHVDIDDILEEEDRPRLAQLLMEHTGWRIAATATFGAGTAMTEEAIAVLDGGDWQAPPPRLAVIEDGSQPPITESLRFLRELRAAAGARAQILLALVGDPTDEDRLPPMRPFDFTDWQRKIDQMADPYLRLEMLARSEEDGDV